MDGFYKVLSWVLVGLTLALAILSRALAVDPGMSALHWVTVGFGILTIAYKALRTFTVGTLPPLTGPGATLSAMLLLIATAIAMPGTFPETPAAQTSPVVVPADVPAPLDVPAVEAIGTPGPVAMVLGALLSPIPAGCGAQWANCKLDKVCDAQYGECMGDLVGAATGPACLGQAIGAIVAGASGQVQIVIADLVTCGGGLVGSSVTDCGKFLADLAADPKVVAAVEGATYAAVTKALTPQTGPSLPGVARAAAPALKVVICRTRAACGQ